MKGLQLYILLIVMLFVTASAYARQDITPQYTFDFRGEPMAEVLDRLAIAMEIDLVYDPALVRDIYVFKRFRDQEKNELLTTLLRHYHLDFITLSSGTVVIVKSALEVPASGIFSGKIVDGITGEPLHGAAVMLADASGGTSTGTAGNFSMPGLISGDHQVIITYLGYEPSYHSIYIPPGREVQERISLIPKSFLISPLVVESHRPRLPGSGSALNPNRDLKPDGVMRSPIRNLNLMPGIQYGLPMADLHIQGGQHGEHRIYLDGVPVYNPYSYGQMFSSFSPFAIGTVKLHKAGYGVQEGSQIAGLIELSHELDNSDKNGALFHGDPLSVNFRGDLSFPLKNHAPVKIIAAARTSYRDIYRESELQQTISNWDSIDPLIAGMHIAGDINAAAYNPAFHDSEMNFYDLHFAAAYEPDEFSSVNASFYMADNFLQTDVLNQSSSGEVLPQYLFASDSHKWSNLSGQISWNKFATARLDFHLQAAYTQNSFEHQNLFGTGNVIPFSTGSSDVSASPDSEGFRSIRPLPTAIDGNHIQHALTKAEASYSFTPGFSVNGGLQLDRVISELNISDTDFLDAGMRQSSFTVSGFLKNQYSFGQFWNLEYGSRLTWHDKTGRVYAEPRASLQYDQPESKIGYWSVRAAGGIYRQFINEYRITNTGASAGVPNFSIWSHAGTDEIPKAYHLTGSFYTEPAPHSSITLELFYKWQPNAAITSYGRRISGDEPHLTEAAAFAENTEMEMAGAGIRFSQSMAGQKIRLIAGYDYSHTRLDLQTQFGKTLPAQWSEPHRAQFRSFYYVLDDLALVLKWQGIWGRTWAFRESYYNFLPFADVDLPLEYNFTNPENDRLSSFQQVDFSMIYKPAVSGTDLEIRVELINLLNRKNVMDHILVPVMDGDNVQYEISERTFPGFYPAMSLQIKF